MEKKVEINDLALVKSKVPLINEPEVIKKKVKSKIEHKLKEPVLQLLKRRTPKQKNSKLL